MKLKPLVRRAGGKSRLLKHIIPLLPVHKHYCEVFGGGLAVFLGKEKSEVETINDIDGDLINLYRILKYHCSEFLREVEFSLHSREEFCSYVLDHGLTDIQRAARWWYRNNRCFGGDSMKSFGSSRVCAAASSQNKLDALWALHRRLDKVTIEKLSWEKLINMYDTKDTLFFLDPPYTDCKINSYAVWNVGEIKKIRHILNSIKGKWILTINDTEENRKVFNGCNIVSIERTKGIDNKLRDSRKYKELIVHPKGQIHIKS